jgi:hypothetical protein
MILLRYASAHAPLRCISGRKIRGPDGPNSEGIIAEAEGLVVAVRSFGSECRVQH